MPLQFPVLYLLHTHLEAKRVQELEAEIPTLTVDAQKAEVILGNITHKERVLFELRRLGLETEEVPPSEVVGDVRRKRRKISALGDSSRQVADSGKISPIGDDEEQQAGGSSSRQGPAGPVNSTRLGASLGRKLRVVKLSWFTDSNARGKILPFDDYILYEGVRPAPKPSEILSRAQLDVAGSGPSESASGWKPAHWKSPGRARATVKRPVLLHQSTSERDAAEQMPPIPEYLRTTYSCQRPTPIDPPNQAFIYVLKKIRTTRLLTGDKVGVRAYSSAIASLAAYPYPLTAFEEVDRLPGCGPKIALLFREFKDRGGAVEEAREAELDPRLSVLKQFYDVWGVAETTAREWYNKGWRDLDDVVEYGWETLNRVQQIGVKFYDEFLLKIPRPEVEAIAGVVLEHANRIRSGFQMVIVGGYRRGKKESGDVDLVLSHPDETATRNFISDLVISLEDGHYITHTLILSTKNSERGQVPVSWKGNDRKAPGSGFDTLDKALVVWQDPSWVPKPGENTNPNPHRRVDIIITPWKTAGCAVLGWTSGTTFQRDMRRYCKRELGLKFDSSGIRSRRDGRWVDMESEGGRPAPDMLTAERRVFAGLNLEWRPPEERSTG